MYCATDHSKLIILKIQAVFTPEKTHRSGLSLLNIPFHKIFQQL